MLDVPRSHWSRRFLFLTHYVRTPALKTSFHTKSGIQCAVDQFLSNKPWISADGRMSGLQTDNASNYRDPLHVLDTFALGAQVFSEQGMGKVNVVRIAEVPDTEHSGALSYQLRTTFTTRMRATPTAG